MIQVRYVGTDEFAQIGADLLAERIVDAVEARGACHLALSGGRAPWELFGVLGRRDLPWHAVHIWQVDERVAPERDVDRNSVGLKTSLLRVVPELERNAHWMDVTSGDLDAAADAYSAELERVCGGVLDIVHLGLGSDGHTASWPPGDPVIDVDDRDVTTTGEFGGFIRMTLTPRCVNRARARVFLITGGDKEAAVAQLTAGGDIPAARVTGDATEAIVALSTPLLNDLD
ncbi:MAG: 6-phosphogluconolactonase [Actinobacteria bacterium]|nr:6-phosphogluconolactonase [Actinomycetota bacterium]